MCATRAMGNGPGKTRCRCGGGETGIYGVCGEGKEKEDKRKKQKKKNINYLEQSRQRNLAEKGPDKRGHRRRSLPRGMLGKRKNETVADVHTKGKGRGKIRL